jgi:BirA family transcriptional regulator, biotin operon repressor / biotin---[acetyl-CoA-carboxylase] ligase
MPFDIDRILRETFVARAEYHPSIGSTNDRAAQSAGELPLLIVADRQTAGRGRGTNRWWTGPGALAFSLLLDGQTVAAGGNRSPLVALAAAVAIVDAVAPLLPGFCGAAVPAARAGETPAPQLVHEHPLGIHWPNDVMVGPRKLAGILIEVLPDGRHVVGIGLNANNTLADAPAELQSTVATLRDLGLCACDPTAILIDLLRGLEREFLELGRQPQSVAARADALCLQRGQVLTLQCGNRTVVGRCLGIAADGAIRLETPTGVETFCTGILRGEPR